MFSRTNTLDAHGEGIEIATRDTSGAYGADGLHPSIDQQSEGNNDTDGVDPTRDSKRDGGFNLSSPLRKGEQVDGSECVDTIDSERNDKEKVKPKVGEGREAGFRLEIVQILDID